MKLIQKTTKKYDVMTVSGSDKLIGSIVLKGNCIKLCGYNEKLFNILNEINLSIRHSGRNHTEYEINKNIIRERIMSF